MSYENRMPTVQAPETPAPVDQHQLPAADDDESSAKRFVRRRAPLIVLLAALFAIMMIYVAISLTATPLPGA
jgi:hypothetical protein